MKTKYFIFAASALVALASCSSDEYVGDNSPTLGQGDGSIQFAYTMPNATRADVVGEAAADILGNGFYVVGTKGSEQETSPSTTLVFDNYLVHYDRNSAGTTKSNTANWEYVGVTPGTDPYDFWAKLSSLNSQSIKYWDYSQAQYDFLAFSTGTKKPVTGDPANDNEIGVTAMNYGAGLASNAVAYTFKIRNTEGLKNTYITDITKVPQANFGKEVQLKFKNLGAKVRVALYETVPGYSVKDVKFYAVEGAAVPTDLGTGTTTAATLISAATHGIPSKGTINVFFPHVGSNNSGEQDYNKASATIETGSTAADFDKAPTFGEISENELQPKAADEVKPGATPGTYVPEDGRVFLGRSLPDASFAGTAAVNFYTPVFPVTTGYPLTLRVDYTLVPVDGAQETIIVKGAKAVVPSTYTTWLPNYAYTYIFKISDNTNGWTGATSEDPGLFPITFDAVVAQASEATGEQTTITTVATPSITTYQQFHNKEKTEYSKKVKNQKSETVTKDLYVQVMNGGTLVSDLDKTNTLDANPKDKSILYSVADGTTEALVIDALQNRTTLLTVDNVVGRNKLTLTKNANLANDVTSIVNGVKDEPIEKIDADGDGDLENIVAGQVAKINMTSITAGTYAYVYDYSDAAKTETKYYQPIKVTTSPATAIGEDCLSITTAALGEINYAANKTTSGQAIDHSKLYFSKTTTDGTNYTYSFYSLEGKTTLPEGLLIVPATSLVAASASTDAVENTFYFTTYYRNEGKYAVKVITIVND